MSEEMKISPRMLVVIAREEDETRIRNVLGGMHLSVFHQLRGQGTATSEWLDICGLSGTTRVLTLAMMPRCMTGQVMTELRHAMGFDKRGHGVAATLKVDGMQGSMLQMMTGMQKRSAEHKAKGESETMAEKTTYSMVLVAVNSGYSGDVVEAARSAGARGGTVLRGVRHGDEKAKQFMGMPMQDEQDIAMIIIPSDKRQEIMSAISAKCGLKAPAQGIVLSLPVDETLGLE